MILGVGTDVCDVARVERAFARGRQDALERKILSDNERRAFETPRRAAEYFAGRFAAKEACLKALGGPSGLSLRDIEILAGANGAPKAVVANESVRPGARLHISITHDAAVAFAVAILESP